MRVLVVDADEEQQPVVLAAARAAGLQVRVEADEFKALGQLRQWRPDVLVLGHGQRGLGALGVARRGWAALPELRVVALLLPTQVTEAVELVRRGGSTCLTKPADESSVRQALQQVLASLDCGNGRLEPISKELEALGIVGASGAMRSLLTEAKQVAASDATVLITGESGTGKELVARAIHHWSPRRAGPMVAMNCAALASGVLESELFGHETGAFTGASRRRPGRFAQADGGTLFLDEVGELEPSVQVKLLRFLQDHTFQPVGSNRSVTSDVRLVAATNRDLATDVEASRFRLDLYYRIKVIELRVPPVRERIDAIAPLARRFVQRFAERDGKPIVSIADEAMLALLRHGWPGNVRELENCIERALVFANGNHIEVRDLPPQVVRHNPASTIPSIPGSTLAELERHAIVSTVRHTGGNVTHAARILGVTPRTIRNRMGASGDGRRSGS